ncbi:MAG: ATP-dependent zinc protease [Candidatus Nitrohelix vancouverensis]|uniref:ATP-dependent zinc protease n=1 Tax=Candidatus Nitrohelix vancouverensis TaxID=2705534 RepID=A0A7T0G2D4_9BACT|nr:MAG: ATP-dependent zinc protease [Candidatus Nitrohelix vancouverensis]
MIKKKHKKRKEHSNRIGWREWVAFPDLNVDSIKAKIDTGARTSSLHAYDIQIDEGSNLVNFKIHPVQRSAKGEIRATAKLIDERSIKSSNGGLSIRPIIMTRIKIGNKLFPIELSLINRDLMGFRLLLGRSALKNHYLVDSGASFLIPQNNMKGSKP